VRILILLLSAWVGSAAFAQDSHAQDAQPRAPVPTQQQLEPVPQSPPTSFEPAAPAPPASAPAAVPRPQSEAATEYWPPIRGYRLKITDTLIAGIAVLLLLAIWLLWSALRRLVQQSERNSERQLRAYLAITPTAISGFRANAAARIECVVRNLGQTSAQRVRHRYSVAILPHPLPPRHKFAPPSRDSGNPFALLPKDETLALFDGDAFTAQQVEAVSRNEARIHCWGYTEYVDIFRVKWRSRFSVSAGGEAFSRAASLPADHPSAPPWSWEYGSGHNEIDEAR